MPSLEQLWICKTKNILGDNKLQEITELKKSYWVNLTTLGLSKITLKQDKNLIKNFDILAKMYGNEFNELWVESFLTNLLQGNDLRGLMKLETKILKKICKIMMT